MLVVHNLYPFFEDACRHVDKLIISASSQI